jgi:hypothetical protein
MSTAQPPRNRPPQPAVPPGRPMAIVAAPLPDIEARDPMFRWLVHLGVPLLISLVVHVFLFTILSLRQWVAGADDAGTDVQYEARILHDDDMPDEGFRWPTATPVEQAESPINWPELPSALNTASELKSPPGDGGEPGGFGLGEIGRSGILGIGGGAGEGGGAGLGPGFGTRAGLGKAEVWQLNASGNRFVYVVDYSGSIVVSVNELKRELKRSIGALGPAQQFNVIVFYEKKNKIITESFAPALQPATPDAKRAFFEWIDRKAPEGSTEPLEALKRALSLDPDAVFFFSDGYFDEKVVEEAIKANRRAKVQINCLVFDEVLLDDFSGLPRLTDGAKRLQRLAERSRGKTKIVTGLDLKPK